MDTFTKGWYVYEDDRDKGRNSQKLLETLNENSTASCCMSSTSRNETS